MSGRNDEGPTLATPAPEAEPITTPASVRDAEQKRFATLREQLASKGFALTRAYAADGSIRYFVGRCGLCRELANIAAVRAFAKQVWVRNG